MAKASDVVDVESNLPDIGEGKHDSLKENALAEAGEAARTAPDESADTSTEVDTSKEQTVDEPTMEELRSVAGEDGLEFTDEELRTEYLKAVAAEAKEAAGGAAIGFPLYDSTGARIEDATKVVLADLLAGKYKFGYTALGKEVQKNITELLRTASLGHFNESKMTRLQSERQMVYDQLETLRREHEAWGTDRKVWDRVLTAATQGNIKPLQQLIDAFATEAGKLPENVSAAETQAELQRNEQLGQQFVASQVVPETDRLAAEYGANPREVLNEFLRLIQMEPAEFVNQERVQEILQYEIPATLEQLGYGRDGEAPIDAGGGDNPLLATVKTLQQQVAELSAESANAKTAALRAKNKRIPSAGGGTASGAGSSVPAMNSRADMKRYLHGETD